MIPPREQWCVQIDVTSACNRRCSNCTRPAVAHQVAPFHVSPVDFAEALEAVQEFPQRSPRDALGRAKIIGMIGGEPLLHPEFEQLCAIMQRVLPAQRRGLWTGLDWRRTRYRELIEWTFGRGYINNNQHLTSCFHTPVLVAPLDVVPDPVERQRLIDGCQMQKEWASSITPRGFFFCEVAGALAQVLPEGPAGLPLTRHCWQADLTAFQAQIDYYCQRCGVCLPLAGRRDSEERDDVSPTNLAALAQSPRVLAGQYVLHERERVTLRDHHQPCRYLRPEE